ncbi:hypothetical protein JMJ35_005006 [Cladonia borealis]|uniref:Uncharacterized protein n=1 Tax=Cladonia borealis TaxID=184061 RepID=A0AA39R3L3_9LECA|nr:hypothetical protein JMJ35_005006 [Cladonia borealis]
MWHSLLLILLGHLISSSVFIGTSAQLFNGTNHSELSGVNSNQDFSGSGLDALPTSNQTVDPSSMIPKEFSAQFTQDLTRAIYALSTYITALLAMIAISAEDFAAYYAGGEYTFKSYADVQINIYSANSPTDPLKACHAIYGLQVAVYSISTMDAWYETSITLYWSRDGIKLPVGYIKIALVTGGSNLTLGLANATQGPGIQPYLLGLPNSTDLLGQDIDTFENVRVTISPTFGGERLTLQEVFLTLMLAVTIIAQHAVVQWVEPFNIKDTTTLDTEFEYQAIAPPRAQPPYFQYAYAALALRILPQAMFHTGKLEDVEFTVNVDGIPVGIGFLKRVEDSSASLVGTL